MKYTKHINHKNKYFKAKNRNTNSHFSKNKLYIILISLTFIFTISIFCYILFFSNYFKLKEDNITINKTGFTISENEIKDFIENSIDDENLLLLSKINIERHIKNKYINIKSVDIIKKYPNKITINLVERKPLFAIYNESEDDSYMVSEDGLIIGKINKDYDYLFKVNYTDKIEESTFIDNNLFEIYNEIVKQVDKVNLKIKKITFTNDNSVVYLDNNINVLLSNQKDIKDTFIIVNTLIENNTNDKEINKIDFRFDKVIVSYL